MLLHCILCLHIMWSQKPPETLSDIINFKFSWGSTPRPPYWSSYCCFKLPSLNDEYIHIHCTHQHEKSIIHCFFFISLHMHAHSDPNLQVRACNLLGGYLTHKETNMRYLALESLSHLATSDLSREAVKKHQDTMLE